MAKAKAAKNIRLILGFLFLIFLIINAVFHTLAVIAGMKGQDPIRLMPEDISPGVRLLIFLIGIGLSWILARMLFKFLISGKVQVGDSTNIAYVLLGYLLLTFATFSFFSVIGWFWLPVLFFILLIYSLLALWKIIGGAFTSCAFALTLVVIICTWYVTG